MYNLKDLLQDETHRDRLAQQIEHVDTDPPTDPPTYLRSIKVKIISNCNLRCEMCKYWRIAKQQLSQETIFSILDSAATLGCQKVHFSGGEVTLHPHLNDVIAHASELGMRANLTSNGIALTKDRAQDWIRAAQCLLLTRRCSGQNARPHSGRAWGV